eukprot:scaffold94925_cov61-Phaeocystis_antarctica.AAC.1
MVCAIAVAFSDATSMKVFQSYVVSVVILPTMDCSDVTCRSDGTDAAGRPAATHVAARSALVKNIGSNSAFESSSQQKSGKTLSPWSESVSGDAPSSSARLARTPLDGCSRSGWAEAFSPVAHPCTRAKAWRNPEHEGRVGVKMLREHEGTLRLAGVRAGAGARDCG